jgi:hypothetical protein
MMRAASLKLARREAERFLPDVCRIRRYAAGTADAQGYTSGTPTDTEAKCRVAPGVGREQLIAGQQLGVMPYTVRLPAETDVTRSDQIVWEDAIGHSHTFEVVGVSSGAAEVLRTATCKEVS